ncbi:hypothetical protein Scep_002101 [Stephania cephalantha]|uniref:beta-galactosidase n=1 Tax=Stephania cephalantha TaxID=152367 RepID=A0AAP0LAD7_9MAGN
MQGFTQTIVQMMKNEKSFESLGGAIILSQIENEYSAESKTFGAAGHSYLNWAANMAVGMNTSVLWVMCKEYDAPYPMQLNMYVVSPYCHVYNNFAKTHQADNVQ